MQASLENGHFGLFGDGTRCLNGFSELVQCCWLRNAQGFVICCKVFYFLLLVAPRLLEWQHSCTARAQAFNNSEWTRQSCAVDAVPPSTHCTCIFRPQCSCSYCTQTCAVDAVVPSTNCTCIFTAACTAEQQQQHCASCGQSLTRMQAICHDSAANLVHQVVDKMPGIVQREVTHLQREVFELKLSQRRLNVVLFPA